MCSCQPSRSAAPVIAARKTKRSCHRIASCATSSICRIAGCSIRARLMNSDANPAHGDHYSHEGEGPVTLLRMIGVVWVFNLLSANAGMAGESRAAGPAGRRAEIRRIRR